MARKKAQDKLSRQERERRRLQQRQAEFGRTYGNRTLADDLRDARANLIVNKPRSLGMTTLARTIRNANSSRPIGTSEALIFQQERQRYETEALENLRRPIFPTWWMPNMGMRDRAFASLKATIESRLRGITLTSEQADELIGIINLSANRPSTNQTVAATRINSWLDTEATVDLSRYGLGAENPVPKARKPRVKKPVVPSSIDEKPIKRKMRGF